MKETDIQSQIIDYLQILEHQGKLFFQRTNNIPVSQIRNGKRVFRSMPKGAKKGFPDIVVLKGGVLIALEVKSATGRQSKDQKEMEKLVVSSGGKYFIVRSLSEVVELMK